MSQHTRPNYFANTTPVGASPWAKYDKKVYNRTGGATVVGGLYQFDMGYTTSLEATANSQGLLLPAASSYNWDVPESVFRNIVTPASTFNAHGFFCVAREAVANREELTVDVLGPVKMNILSFQGYFAPITNGTWTAASHTLTSTGNFAGLTAALAIIGATAIEFVVTGGTGATLGTYTISSKTSNDAIVLATDIAAGNLATGDIAGYLKVTFPAGTKIEAGTTAGGNATNATSANRRVAFLPASTVLRADQVATGQSVDVIMTGWGMTGGSRI